MRRPVVSVVQLAGSGYGTPPYHRPITEHAGKARMQLPGNGNGSAVQEQEQQRGEGVTKAAGGSMVEEVEA